MGAHRRRPARRRELAARPGRRLIARSARQIAAEAEHAYPVPGYPERVRVAAQDGFGQTLTLIHAWLGDVSAFITGLRRHI